MFGTKKQEAPPPVVPKPKLLELSVISPDDVTLNLGDEGVPATSPKPILAKLPSSESRRGSANFQKAAFTELVTELEKTSICGGKTYKAWSRKKLECSVFDTIAFRWLEKDFCLTIEGNNLDLDGNTDCDKVVFSDPDNTRAYQWTFQAEGTYKVTCMDMGPTDDMFEMYIYVTNSTKQLIRSVLANAFFFLILIGLCMGVALGAQWFLRAEFLGPAKDTDGVSWCYKENLYTQSTETSAWTAIRDDGLCCKYTGCEETPGANEKWKLFCGTAEEDWTAEIQAATLSVWKGKYDQVYSTGTICSQEPAALTSPDEEADYAAVMLEAVASVALEYSFVPVILGVLTMVIGPLLGVYNFLKPQPLTSYGRGFEQNIHSNIRSLLGAIALALFLTVILGWNAYGENGNAIEIMMVEVNGLAIFVGTELGEAAGSLGVALNQTNYINTEYQDYPNLGSKQGFYRNEDCPSSVADDACTAYLTANPVAVPMYLEQTLPYRYGGPPGALKGDPSFCPKPAGKSSRNGDNSWTTAEISNYQMCILNLKAFYGMGHAFAGYPGEGRVFDPDPATDSNGDFILDGNGATTFAKPYLVSTEITDLLDLLDSEAKNSDSYAELGKQMIESMMRMRQILVYFMMQVALIASATCAAGAFRSSQKLIRSGGWCALIGLVIALFSYSINKPIAVMVEETVTILIGANEDMDSLTEEEKKMPLMQILAYCKPPEEGSDTSGFDLSFATDLAAMIDPAAAATASTPAAIKLSIEAATNTMSGLLLYFQSTPDLRNALGNGLDFLPVMSNVFAAVNNIIEIISCGTAFTYFLNMVDVLDQLAVPSFNKIAACEIAMAVLLASLFVVSRFTAFILDRPRKLFHCAETNRWFRFKAAYNAHVAVLERKKKAGILDFASRFLRHSTPSFSCVGMALDIAAVFHITLFVMVPNAFMAMGGSGFRGVPEYVPTAMLVTSVVGLISTWRPSKSWWRFFGALVSMLGALVACGACLWATKEMAERTQECYEVVNEAMNDVTQANAAGEELSYAEALTEAQVSLDFGCSFTDISDYAQSMIFCLVNTLMTFICFLSGVCYVCARKHMMTDDVRKTMLKKSAEHTAQGEINAALEGMGGSRTDGLGGSALDEGAGHLKYRVRATLCSWKFWVMVILGGGGFVFTGYFMLKAGDTAMEAGEDVLAYNFYECDKMDSGCCNGLKSNCDKKIDEVTFAAIHNSMSNGQEGWLGPNNRLPHHGALVAGYRALMVDLFMYDDGFAADDVNGDSVDGERLYACHGVCSLGKRSAFDEFNITKSWLDNNPNEIVQYFFENPSGIEGDDALFDVFEELGLNDMLIEKDANGDWPSMKDAIAGGKRILVLKMAGCDSENSDTMTSGRACPVGYYNGFANMYDTPYSLAKLDEVYVREGGCADAPDCDYTYHREKGFDFRIQERGGVQVLFDEATGFGDSMFTMNHFITPPIAAFALQMNTKELLTDRVEALEKHFCQRVNWIAIDFWSVGEFGPLKATQWNNKRPVPTGC